MTVSNTAVHNLLRWAEKRAAENSVRAACAPPGSDRNWHAGKADTYRLIAQKLQELVNNTPPDYVGRPLPTDETNDAAVRSDRVSWIVLEMPITYR